LFFNKIYVICFIGSSTASSFISVGPLTVSTSSPLASVGSSTDSSSFPSVDSSTVSSSFASVGFSTASSSFASLPFLTASSFASLYS
jgi:hypothetical protein